MQNKRGSFALIAVIIILLAGVILFILLFNQSDDSQSSQLSNSQEVNESIAPVEQTPFEEQPSSPENQTSDFNTTVIHWEKASFSYGINNEEICGENTLENLQIVLEEIEESTDSIIQFTEGNDSSEIQFNCIDGNAEILELGATECEEKIYDYDKTRFDPVGDEVITRDDFLINYTEVFRNITVNDSDVVYSVCYIPASELSLELSEPVLSISKGVITSAQINIYRSEGNFKSCSNFPAREAHAILHAFGFAHAEEPSYDKTYGYSDFSPLKDIMFPELLCKYQTKIDEKYLSCLKKIYASEGSCDEVNFVE